ncbi:aminopeptidase [Alicyclobacillus cycloheptanicus]|uniref:Aminopeptidase n=1 Tax=Alicyclobacillus cycloheptanicus TaxID=1457 RepID=A0ABT9XI84_9BACL|nr:aminopeptidase [Alicyclobacillus cycloheptanicus]MDQ0190016.1 aminopeptidase [Alicyclobacillus cycloheptanicus]WDM00079.1 aminopeptidase [Alicyclobacillus cycloheptanicus]
MELAKRLENYAEVIVRVGLNIQPGQDLLIAAPIEAADFVRHIVDKAYDTGARNVVVNWEDEQLTRLRYLKAPDEAFLEFPDWRVQQMEDLMNRDGAYLVISARDPDLLAGVDPARIATSQRVGLARMKPFNDAVGNMQISWLISSIPTKAWAARVFPEVPPEEQVNKLWDAVLSTSRVDTDHPVAHWQAHIDQLRRRADDLNQQHFVKLHYRSAVTDLTIELPEDHVWIAAYSTSRRGARFVPNIPTEEVFTLPKRDGVNGVVRSTKPLNHGGTLIDHFTLTFEQGRIVDFSAEQGYEALRDIIETDEGSHYLGEVALVPHDSPISRLDRLFYNTLFDENASCHLAIGHVIPVCLRDGVTLSREELLARGANDSLTHVDFMMGSSDLNIDGIKADGQTVPVFRNGNWV